MGLYHWVTCCFEAGSRAGRLQSRFVNETGAVKGLSTVLGASALRELALLGLKFGVLVKNTVAAETLEVGTKTLGAA